MNKPSLLQTEPITRDTVDAALAEYRLITIAVRKMMLERDEAIAAIDARVNPELEKSNARLKELHETVESWSDLNPTAFGDKKSIETLDGTFGYRLGQPRLAPIKPYTWEKVVDILKNMTNGDNYLRIREEVDKTKLLADAAGLGTQLTNKLHLKVIQDTRFYVEPTLEDSQPQPTN
jgi:phage host-nuclease inhibitor protein Gam